MESEAISIDEYLDSDVEQRFDFLYENYAVLKAIIKDYREDIITDVIEMKSYNRRAANGDLGVRVQVSMGVHSFEDLAKKAKAVYHVNRIVLVNTEKVDEYMELMCADEIYLSDARKVAPEKLKTVIRHPIKSRL